VAITLDYRPDVLKGAVSGQITGVGIQPSPTAYAMAVLVDPATGASLGIDVKTVDQGLPVAFSIPYSVTDIKPTEDYVVTAEVGDSNASWRNDAGVPVITKGNPKSGVQVVVTEVSTATATAAPSPTPAPSPAPTGSGRGGDGGLLPLLILIAIIVAVAAFLIARGRGEPDTLAPEGRPTADGAAAAPEAGAESDTGAAAGVGAAGAEPDTTAGTAPDATPPPPTPEPPGSPPDATRPA
jgi:hypothetical protein